MHNSKKFISGITGVFILSMLLSSCGSNPSDDNGGTDIDTASQIGDELDRGELKKSSRKFLNTVPSPTEVMGIVVETGARFNAEFLNSPANDSKYSTTKLMALNLGVYGADLSYCSIFDQTQQGIFFLQSCEKMAKGIGIAKAFGPNAAERIENNINDKDSILQIISDNYYASKDYLEESEKNDIASLMTAGGWIEVLFIATNLVEGNDGVRKRIAEQQLSLNNLIAMLKAYGANEDVKSTLQDLEELNSVYKKVKINYTYGEATKDEESGVMVINTTSEIDMSDEVLNVMIEKVAEIRNKITQP